MTKTGNERANTFPWPPVIYVSALAAGFLLDRLVPLPWIGPPLVELLFAFGWLLAAAGLVLALAAIRTLRRAGTGILPHAETTHLVTRGPFALTRNPIYLGNTTILVGIGLIAGSPWFLALAPAAAFLTRKLVIEREEKHLKLKFAKSYRDYARRVRRWI